MKKLNVMLAFAATVVTAMILVTNPLSAERKYGMAGCGVGSLVFSPNKGQLSASTTNQSSGQIYSITTGTSNCVPDSPAAALRLEQEIFMQVNMVGLQHEMATGQGEKISAFARLMGCPVADFGRYTRTNYKDLHTQTENPSKFLDLLREKVATDKKLAKACNVV